MTLENIIEKFDEKFVVECPSGLRKGDLVLNPIYPDEIKSFLRSSYSELLDSKCKEIVDSLELYIRVKPNVKIDMKFDEEMYIIPAKAISIINSKLPKEDSIN